MNRFSILVCSLCLSVLIIPIKSFAQKNSLASADQAFSNMAYADALDMYKKAYTDLHSNRDKAKKARVLFQIAECYRMMNEPKEEIQAYAKAIKAKYDDPVCLLYLANADKMMGQYDSAMVYYNKYKDAVPSDPQGTLGVKSCEVAAQLKNNPTRFVVNDEQQLNTKYSDFAPAFADRRFDELFFTSTRPGSTGDQIDNAIGQNFSDIYETKRDKNGKWSEPTPLPSPANSEGNDGTPCFDKGYKTMYFTRCLLVNKQQQKCKIYSTERRGNTWAQPVELDFQVDSVTYGHPALSPDNTELFFASDLSGGYGQHDIWVSHFDKKNHKWGEPKNLGPEINTPGDEVYPYVRFNGDLYFASDGYPGLGGKDIYVAKKVGPDKWGTPTNMGVPINSEGDDFAITFQGTGDRGFFSSNRLGGRGSDDIYSFELPPLLFDLQGHVVNADTKKPLEKATMHLVGSDGSDVTLTTDTGGFYNFGANGNSRYIKPNTSYILTCSADNVVKAKDVSFIASGSERANETTVALTESKTFVHNFEFQPVTMKTVLHFPKVLYDLDKATLLQQSKDSLNYLVKLLNDNPTICIILDAHTDPQGSYKHNMVLSQARAQACVDYLESQGIDSARLEAKGWGFTRTLPGLDGNSIKKMKTKQMRDSAYALDRRTEFRVHVGKTFIPKNRKLTAQDSLKMMHMEITGQSQVDTNAADTVGASSGANQQQSGNAPAQQPKNDNMGNNNPKSQQDIKKEK